jgi:hypothetical protein
VTVARPKTLRPLLNNIRDRTSTYR